MPRGLYKHVFLILLNPFRSGLGADLRGNVELPPLHPRRRSAGDRAAQYQPSGSRIVPVRGEDRVGDAFRVTIHPEKPFTLQTKPTLTN